MLAHARPSRCALMVAAAAHTFELPPAFALPFPQPALNVQLYHPCPRNAEVLILHPRSLSYPGSQLSFYIRCSAKWQDQDCSRNEMRVIMLVFSMSCTSPGTWASLLLTSAPLAVSTFPEPDQYIKSFYDAFCVMTTC